MFLDPVTLKGDHVTLVPLSPHHHDELVGAVQDGELWKLWYTFIPEPDNMGREIERRLGLQKDGSMLPFAIISNDTGKAVGMTNFMHADAVNRRVEIGGTWYRASSQRTALNTECKYLMLRYAFENLECIAVEFRTHVINMQSRRGIERLGAKLDGTLRNHMVMPDGTMRDTVVYSIIAGEWPAVKSHLEWQMQRPRR